MSYIPDCREDDYYNFDKLNDADQEFVRGFDWCTEMAADNFFDNFLFGDEDSYLGHILSQDMPEDMQGEYTIERTFVAPNETERTEIRQVKTYLDLIRSEMLDWIESCRDELITGIIDGYEEGDGE